MGGRPGGIVAGLPSLRLPPMRQHATNASHGEVAIRAASANIAQAPHAAGADHQGLSSRIAESPRMVAQGQLLNAMYGPAIQRIDTNEQAGALSASRAPPQRQSTDGRAEPVVQRQVLAKVSIAPGSDEDRTFWIVEVVLGGRTPSPFAGTMGAHSTAWIAHTDMVRRMLVNTQLPREGADNLIQLARHEREHSELLQLQDLLGPAHRAKLESAGTALDEQCNLLQALVDSDAPSHQEIISQLRLLIDRYLTFVNYLPMATVSGGDPAGHGESSARSDISAFEYVSARTLATAGSQPHKEELAKEVATLSTKGIPGLIRQQHDGKGTPELEEQLKQKLSKALWQLFAAETPIAFAKSVGADETTQAKIWRQTVANFLKTIMAAYPYSYDFTQMHKEAAQRSGFAHALKYAGVALRDDQLPTFPVVAEEAEIRETHDEVTLADLKQAGSGFLCTVLLSDNGSADNRIGDVVMIGRTRSPFAKTMGAHTTAWAAHLDAVRSFLIGKTVVQALDALKAHSEEAMQEEGLALAHHLDEKHQLFLLGGHEMLHRSNEQVAAAKTGSLQEQVAAIEAHVGWYLNFVNMLPLSTLESGGVPGGRSEGMHRTFLQKYEQSGSRMFDEQDPKPSPDQQRQSLLQHLTGMYDGEAINLFPPALGDREPGSALSSMIDPSEATKTFAALHLTPKLKDTVDPSEIAFKRFLRTMTQAYPRAMKDSGLMDADMATAKQVQQSSLNKIETEEGDELRELLQQNNCLINAISLAALQRKVTPQELLDIRLRIGQIGTMLIAEKRTLSIICDVLKIDRGIVVTYAHGAPSEDFGNTDDNPIFISHTGAAHFVPWSPDTQRPGANELALWGGSAGPMQPGADLPELQAQVENFLPTLVLDLESLIGGAPLEGSLMFQLGRILPPGATLNLSATFQSGDTDMEEELELDFDGAPALAAPESDPLAPQPPVTLPLMLTPPPPRKRKATDDDTVALRPPAPKRIKRLVVRLQMGPAQFQLNYTPPGPGQARNNPSLTQ